VKEVIIHRSIPQKIYLRVKAALQRLKRPAITFLLNRKQFSLSQSILLFGEVRGGTTWLMELLAKIPGMVTNFEPLHGTRGVVPQAQEWHWRPLLLKDHKNPEDHQLLEEIFTFRQHNWYTNSTLKFRHFISPRFVLTKMVRGNQALPYVVANMKLAHRPILLIRHPISSCISFLKAFGNYGHPQTWKIPPLNLHTQRNHQYYDYLTSGHSDLAYRVARWCVNNAHILPRKEFKDKVVIVFYEDLLIDPEAEMKRIINELKIDIDQDAFLTSIEYRSPSSSNFKNQFNKDPNEQLSKGITALSDEEKQEIQDVFDHFDFKLYDAFTPYPKKDQLYSI